MTSLLKTNPNEAILVSKYADILYLTDYAGFSENERDAYVVSINTKLILFTNPLYAHEVSEKIKNIQVIETSAKNPLSKALGEILNENKITTLRIQENDLTIKEYRRLKEIKIILKPITLSLRVAKNVDQIAEIKNACMLSDKAYKHVSTKLKEGITELGVAWEMEKYIKENGGELSFPTIVAFGKNSAIPHHHTDETKLKKNDVVLLDFGVKINNYCSDTSRTVYFGDPTDEFKKVYDAVYESQKAAVDFISTSLKKTVSINTSDVDKVSRDYLISKGYPSIPHSLGHGIGIEVHEAPSLSPNSKDELSEGMVFSIEPGVYLDDEFGVRIEDLFTIHENKLIHLQE